MHSLFKGWRNCTFFYPLQNILSKGGERRYSAEKNPQGFLNSGEHLKQCLIYNIELKGEKTTLYRTASLMHYNDKKWIPNSEVCRSVIIQAGAASRLCLTI